MSGPAGWVGGPAGWVGSPAEAGGRENHVAAVLCGKNAVLWGLEREPVEGIKAQTGHRRRWTCRLRESVKFRKCMSSHL